MEIVHDLARLDFSATTAMIRASYWNGRRTDAIDAVAFANSVCAIAIEDGHQIGFARAAGDRAAFMRLMDVIVWPEARGRGVASTMVLSLLQHDELRDVGIWFLGTRDAHGLYERFGFRRSDQGFEMRLDRPAAT